MNEAEIRQLAEMNGLVAEMHSKVARVEGMKIRNEVWKKTGDGFFYNEGAFIVVQQELEEISQRLKTEI